MISINPGANIIDFLIFSF